MAQDCKSQIYAEEYLDYLVEYFPDNKELSQTEYCYQLASNRFAVLYEKGESYQQGDGSSVKAIPHCYGLLSSEQVLESAGITKVRRQSGLNLFGQGVLVGFVDTGIDYSHPAFIGSGGKSRIVSIWDQTAEELREGEHTPEGFAYGAEYTQEDIDRALASETPLDIVPSRDEDGHGTFVAGVACGNDMAEQSFSGVAPLSKICVVKCKQAKQNLRDYYFINTSSPCYAENDIMLGIRYLWLQAGKYQMPLVIFLGMGTNQGGHNRGGILGELLADYGDYRGILAVTAGGNEANASHHFQNDTFNNAEDVEVEVKVGANESGFTLELWAAATELYSVGLISPGGEYSGKTSARLGEKRQVSFLFEETVVYIEYLLVSFENGDECIRLRFQKPVEGVWKIRVFNEMSYFRRFDMWLPIRNFIDEETYFLRANPDTTLCDPSNNPDVITSAYYNSANRSVAIESGRGFTREYAIKPDIAAPGVNVYGTLPFAGRYPSGEERNERARYGVRTGSSAAAAVTAGAAALLAEWAFIKKNDVAMDTQKAKKYLIRGADRSGITIPSRTWGNGTLDLYNTFDRLRTPQS
jgi:subtilisin family serine protease